MRVQIDGAAVDVVGTEVIDADQSTHIIKSAVTLLQEAGFDVTQSRDHADVTSDMEDWPYLTAEEQLVQGFEYPQLHVDGDSAITLCVFRRSVSFSSSPYDDTAQEAASDVVRALRALSPVLPLPAATWQRLEEDAAEVAVAPDGSIIRPVISFGDLYFSAINLFDEQLSPEFGRSASANWATRIAVLGNYVSDLPPFRGVIATSPSGDTMSMGFPRGGAPAEALHKAATVLLAEALAASDERTGAPTGIVIEHDETGTYGAVVFDNPVDGGAVTPGGRPPSHRRAPHAWQEIVRAAASRDPQFQPTWLPDAVALLWEAGITVPVLNAPLGAELPNDVERLPEPPAAPAAASAPEAQPGLMQRLGRWLSGRGA